MPINFFKQPLNHDWTCLKAIIIHQHAIEPIPSSGSSITPKLRAGTKFCALISTCSFKLSSGPINPPPNLLIGTEFWALPPFFVNRFDDFFYPLISFLFATWGENAWIFRSIFPAGDQLSRPPSMATRLAQLIGWHPTVCDPDNRGNKTRNGSDWSRQGKKEHTVGWEVDKLWKEWEELKY